MNDYTPPRYVIKTAPNSLVVLVTGGHFGLRGSAIDLNGFEPLEKQHRAILLSLDGRGRVTATAGEEYRRNKPFYTIFTPDYPKGHTPLARLMLSKQGFVWSVELYDKTEEALAMEKRRLVEEALAS